MLCFFSFSSSLCCVMRQNLRTPPLVRSFSACASPTRSPPVFPLPRGSSELPRTTLSWRLSVCNCCHISAACSRFFRLVSAHLSQELVWEECGGTAVRWQRVGAPTRIHQFQGGMWQSEKRVVRGHTCMWTGWWACLSRMVIISF